MPELEKVSIIITVYNKKDFIKENLASILSQNYKNLEIIYINDNSSDDSLSTLLSIKDKRVNVYSSSKNYGTYACRNFGIKKSTGKYVTFVDADDQIDIGHISNLLNIIKNHDKIAVASMYKRFDMSTKKFGESKICEASIMIKKEVFDKIGYYEFVRFGADTEFRLRIIKQYGIDNFGVLAHCSYIANQSINSLTNSKKTGHKSEARKDYKEKFTLWHKSNKNLFVKYNSLDRYKLHNLIVVKNFDEKSIKKYK